MRSPARGTSPPTHAVRSPSIAPAPDKPGFRTPRNPGDSHQLMRPVSAVAGESLGPSHAVFCGSAARLSGPALAQQAEALQGERQPGPGILVVQAAAKQSLDAGQPPVQCAPLNPQFPRSIRFAACVVQVCLQGGYQL